MCLSIISIHYLFTNLNLLITCSVWLISHDSIYLLFIIFHYIVLSNYTTAKGKKKLLRTLQNSYSLFVQSQITWRGMTNHGWAKQDPRSFLSKQPVAKHLNVIVLLGKQKKLKANDWLFQQLQDHWAVLLKPYDQFRDRYRTYVRQRTATRQTVVPFHKWQSRNPNSVNFDKKEAEKYEQEKIWQTMDRNVWEVQRVTFDGVLFRSQPNQDIKGTLTDNSFITGEVNQKSSDQSRQTRVKCYGRIQKFYLHFMHPPSSEDLKQATFGSKLDQNKIRNVPWCVLAWCDWYVEAGLNPVNGLVQVQHKENWNEGCPFIDLTHCLPRNCECWPSVPFDITKYDNEGLLKDGMTDTADRSKDLHDVIEHHE
jgi:hypothetical protein